MTPIVTQTKPLCFCAPDVRKVLAQKFINGWVGESWYTLANNLVADPPASEEAPGALLFKIDAYAKPCYGVRHNTV